LLSSSVAQCLNSSVSKFISMTYKTSGIILKKQDWRDYDRLFTFYTKDFGKISAVSRGVKKIKSKLAGNLQELAVIDLFIINGRRVDQLGGAVIDKNFLRIKANLDLINATLSSLELVDQLTKEKLADPDIFSLLEDFLSAVNSINQPTGLKAVVLSQLFNFKFFDLLGYRPELYNCLECKNKISSGVNYFDYSGGVVCQNCQPQNLKLISKEAIKILRFSLDHNLGDYLKVNINKNLDLELISIIDNFMKFRLDKELKSRAYIMNLVMSH